MKRTVRALFHGFSADLSVATGVNFELYLRENQHLQKKHSFSVSWSDLWKKIGIFDVLDESYPALNIGSCASVARGRTILSREWPVLCSPRGKLTQVDTGRKGKIWGKNNIQIRFSINPGLTTGKNIPRVLQSSVGDRDKFGRSESRFWRIFGNRDRVLFRRITSLFNRDGTSRIDIYSPPYSNNDLPQHA